MTFISGLDARFLSNIYPLPTEFKSSFFFINMFEGNMTFTDAFSEFPEFCNILVTPNWLVNEKYQTT